MFIYTCFGQVLKGKTNLASSESEFDEATWSEGCKDSAKTRRREEETLSLESGELVRCGRNSLMWTTISL